jgi:hypothetical protein
MSFSLPKRSGRNMPSGWAARRTRCAAISGVPCPLPRRIETGALVDCFPAHAAGGDDEARADTQRGEDLGRTNGALRLPRIHVRTALLPWFEMLDELPRYAQGVAPYLSDHFHQCPFVGHYLLDSPGWSNMGQASRPMRANNSELPSGCGRNTATSPTSISAKKAG